MKGFVIIQCNHPNGWLGKTSNGPADCDCAFYVVASSSEEALLLVPTSKGKKLEKEFSSLSDLETRISFLEAPMRYYHPKFSTHDIVEALKKHKAIILRRDILCHAV